MEAKLRLASVVLFGLVSLFLIWFGFTYATVKTCSGFTPPRFQKQRVVRFGRSTSR